MKEVHQLKSILTLYPNGCLVNQTVCISMPTGIRQRQCLNRGKHGLLNTLESTKKKIKFYEIFLLEMKKNQPIQFFQHYFIF